MIKVSSFRANYFFFKTWVSFSLIKKARIFTEEELEIKRMLKEGNALNKKPSTIRHEVVEELSLLVSAKRRKLKEIKPPRAIAPLETWDQQLGFRRWTSYAYQLQAFSESNKLFFTSSLFFWIKEFFYVPGLFPVIIHENVYPVVALIRCCSGMVKGWRNLRGYPTNGQRTHSNAKGNKKNRGLLDLLVQGFIYRFGEFKKSLYPTVILAEFNNLLWYSTWFYEWYEASFLVKHLTSGKNSDKSLFNPLMLAGNQANGFTRRGKAAKKGKAKQITKVFTIGVPLFFSRWTFLDPLPEGFDTRLRIPAQTRRIMSKKKNQFKIK